ncbi:MAG TPA: hypothetical protein VNZ22_09810, partial [Bacillota bacterium]|nr:hypothetical protein [Bacillota bacterium]
MPVIAIISKGLKPSHSAGRCGLAAGAEWAVVIELLSTSSRLAEERSRFTILLLGSDGAIRE